MQVYRYEGDVAVFLKSMIDIYGLPEYYGYTDYIVISDNESPMVTDYDFEQDRRTRPVHRYCRVERFTFILSQLLGLRGIVPEEVFDDVEDCCTFDDIRMALKLNGHQRYYNSIPSIMKKIGLDPPIILEMTNTLFNTMINDFLIIQAGYNTKSSSRKYFPSLRYIAIKILMANGAIVNLLPIRTKRKLKILDDIWDNIFS